MISCVLKAMPVCTSYGDLAGLEGLQCMPAPHNAAGSAREAYLQPS